MTTLSVKNAGLSYGSRPRYPLGLLSGNFGPVWLWENKLVDGDSRTSGD